MCFVASWIDIPMAVGGCMMLSVASRGTGDGEAERGLCVWPRGGNEPAVGPWVILALPKVQNTTPVDGVCGSG